MFGIFGSDKKNVGTFYNETINNIFKVFTYNKDVEIFNKKNVKASYNSKIIGYMINDTVVEDFSVLGGGIVFVNGKELLISKIKSFKIMLGSIDKLVNNGGYMFLNTQVDMTTPVVDSQAGIVFKSGLKTMGSVSAQAIIKKKTKIKIKNNNIDCIIAEPIWESFEIIETRKKPRTQTHTSCKLESIDDNQEVIGIFNVLDIADNYVKVSVSQADYKFNDLEKVKFIVKDLLNGISYTYLGMVLKSISANPSYIVVKLDFMEKKQDFVIEMNESENIALKDLLVSLSLRK